MNILKRFLFLWVPLIVTMVWALVVGFKVYNHLQASPRILELNGLGDFVAGAMSPLAIFWLVMVYMQQRKEMRDQVRQTKEIARETREQVIIMKRDIAIRHEPLFVCESFTKQTGHGPHFALIKIINFGGVALHLNVEEKQNSDPVEIGPSRHVQTDKEVNLKIPYNGNLEEATDAFIEFGYQNRFGVKSKYKCFFGKGATKEDFFSDKLPSQE